LVKQHSGDMMPRPCVASNQILGPGARKGRGESVDQASIQTTAPELRAMKRRYQEEGAIYGMARAFFLLTAKAHSCVEQEAAED
jgi:hypothetical protein